MATEMKAFFALPFALLLGAASTLPAEVQTGRSVAVETSSQKYWLSDDLNRLFLQKSGAEMDRPTTRPQSGVSR